MKKWLIKIAKKNAVLYRIAKKLYRSVRPAAPTLYRSQDYFMVYQLHALEEMDDILRHYAQVRRDNTRIVVVVHGHTLGIHRLMRVHPGVRFLSLDYYERYHRKLTLKNIVLMDWRRPAEKMLNYI